MKNKQRLIYADEVIEVIDEIIGNVNFSSPYQNDIHLIVEGLERARDCVLDTPTVDAAEVVHSAWKYGNCMKCGLYVGETTSLYFSYCPNCGAKMDGGK